MSKLPSDVPPRELIKVLQKKGFHFSREGSRHTVYERGQGQDKIVVTIPRHGTLKRGLLHGILQDAGITVEEFNLLR
jgi:predicted RNA binding protein YcfA (HicA-like mRNA interferase family)